MRRIVREELQRLLGDPPADVAKALVDLIDRGLTGGVVRIMPTASSQAPDPRPEG